ncbi:MAG: amino acid ABC transporter substrate-binding protein [Lachnospiraceae bacterium]|nr:amino acid ABC transporter substrate-binding protein [Lachnospiraceae bacterium]
MKRGCKAHLLAGVLFILILAVLCVSCGKAAAKDDDSLQKVLDAKELVLGLDAHYPPMGFVDESGEITGFDIDMAEEVCKRLGVTLIKQPINWDEKETELAEGRIDCIWNGFSVNDSRSESMNLSEPYMINELVFAVSGVSGIKSVNDLRGKRVGIQSGSTAVDVLEESAIRSEVEAVERDDNVELLDLLELGELDAVLMDSIFAYYYISEKNKDYYLLPNAMATEGIAIGFRKTDAVLRDRVQQIINEMKKDGSLADISVKWFGTDITTFKRIQ